MKKFLTVLFGVAVATSLAMPVYARRHKKSKDADASSTQPEKSHKKHGKKKGGDMSGEHMDAPKQ